MFTQEMTGNIISSKRMSSINNKIDSLFTISKNDDVHEVSHQQVGKKDDWTNNLAYWSHVLYKYQIACEFFCKSKMGCFLNEKLIQIGG